MVDPINIHTNTCFNLQRKTTFVFSQKIRLYTAICLRLKQYYKVQRLLHLNGWEEKPPVRLLGLETKIGVQKYV